MIKHVIFDFDGTLVDSEKVLVSSWNLLAKRYRLREIGPDEIKVIKKLPIRGKIRRINFPIYKVPILAPEMYKLYRDSINEMKLFHGIKEVLHQLEKKGYKITIISSNSKENILTFLKRNKITSITKVISSSSIFGKDKLIYRYLRENNLKASEVVYVGDEQRDIIASKKTGVKMIWVGWGYDSVEAVVKMKPDFTVYTPEEILNIL
ncbi:HAD-IA family hydrolase [Oceanobacillus salinisoli]|uniref:HAD-IA family hydrolase n=1 Tax=Oceanobacillus salinisoli TaxID=2678611 RepID=UPI001E4A1D76|nr:HAD-IA family hydrolase [Oceanobacillus salinisoli]